MRRFHAAAWLGIFAMLLQLLLPVAHAAVYAQRSGDPLAYAICGSGSPALLAQMRKQLPAELKRDLEQRHAQPSLPDCQLCVAVHAPTAAAAAADTYTPPDGLSPAAPIRAGAAFHSTRLLPPPPRGPPTPA